MALIKFVSPFARVTYDPSAFINDYGRAVFVFRASNHNNKLMTFSDSCDVIYHWNTSAHLTPNAIEAIKNGINRLYWICSSISWRELLWSLVFHSHDLWMKRPTRKRPRNQHNQLIEKTTKTKQDNLGRFCSISVHELSISHRAFQGLCFVIAHEFVWS